MPPRWVPARSPRRTPNGPDLAAPVLLGRLPSLDSSDAVFGPVPDARYPNPTAKTGSESHLSQRRIAAYQGSSGKAVPIRHRVLHVSTSRDREQRDRQHSFRTFNAPRIPHERRWGCGSRAAAPATTPCMSRAASTRSWRQDQHAPDGVLRKGQSHDHDPVLGGRTTHAGKVERSVPHRDRSQPERDRGASRRTRPLYAPRQTVCAGAARDSAAGGGSRNELGHTLPTISRICASISSTLNGIDGARLASRPQRKIG